MNSVANVSMVVPVPDDQQFRGTQEYMLCLMTESYSAVMFLRRCAAVTVYDNDGKVWLMREATD